MVMWALSATDYMADANMKREHFAQQARAQLNLPITMTIGIGYHPDLTMQDFLDAHYDYNNQSYAYQQAKDQGFELVDLKHRGGPKNYVYDF